MKTSILAVTLAALAGVSSVAHAGQDAAKAGVASLFPAGAELAVSETPIPGLYEVRSNATIVYASADGKVAIQGSMYDVATRTDLTERARAAGRVDALASVGKDRRISFEPEGEIKYRVTVFTDIDCGYCRKLHQEMKGYNDLGIAVDYLAFPRGAEKSPAWGKAVSVFCADDRQHALTEAKAGRPIEDRTCQNPVRQDFDLGVQLGVRGTPAIFTEDGVQIGGYTPPAQMFERLEKLASEKATVTAIAKTQTERGNKWRHPWRYKEMQSAGKS